MFFSRTKLLVAIEPLKEAKAESPSLTSFANLLYTFAQARSQPDIFGGARAIFGGANIFSFTYVIMRFVI